MACLSRASQHLADFIDEHDTNIIFKTESSL